VLDETAVKQFMERVIAVHSRLDILVNCVGGYEGGKKLWETDSTTYERMLDLNLKAGFVLARAALPPMIRQNRGWVVNVAGRAGIGPAAGASMYGASKAAAISLFTTLAEEVKNHKININSVLPSIIDTPANRAAMPKADFSKWPKPEEIARVILFLCSDEARLVTGAAIPV
jgi:NAD(P)-dependent dehydrogenase (short-subunit alcohol dehydrogenase family)